MEIDESRPERARSYHWFQGDSVRELYNQLDEYGPDVARLEVHVIGDRMHFRVINANHETLPPINESHLCPPDC